MSIVSETTSLLRAPSSSSLDIPSMDLAQAPQDKTVTKVHSKMLEIFNQKKNAKDQAVKNRLNEKGIFDELSQINGDALSTGAFVFYGIQAVRPDFAALTGFSVAGTVIGFLAGGINILVGIVEIIGAIKALKNGDKIYGIRGIIDGAFLILIGLVMILIAIAAYIGLGAITAFLAANPFILPLLFFIITIPMIVDVFARNIPIWKKTDIGSQILKSFLDDKGNLKTNVDEILTSLNKIGLFNVDSFKTLQAWVQNFEKIPKDFIKRELKGFLHTKLEIKSTRLSKEEKDAVQNTINAIDTMTNDELEKELNLVIIEKLSDIMERLQNEVGVEAGLAIYKLICETVNQKNTGQAIQQGTVDKVKSCVKGWHRAQTIRLVQQMLSLLAFPLSMIAIQFTGNSQWINNLITAILNFFLAGSNFIPLGMDSSCPFKRNIPVVVDAVDPNRVYTQLFPKSSL